MTDPSELSATQAKAAMEAGNLTSEQLVRACLARIEKRDADVKAWVHLDAGLAIAQARECDKSVARGPLHGIPVGIKDVFLTRDMPTQYNSPIYANLRPGLDAAAVTLLRQAGAVILGKTDTVEFAATGRKALTRNPHDLARTPGGSSSGSAAAVADFHVPLSLGTQTGGSMIRPASFCGVWAMKPTWNTVSNEGARRYAASLDTVGWFGRSSADLALLYEAFANDVEIVQERAIGDMRIACLRTPYWDRADSDTKGVLEATRAAVMAMGAELADIELPHSLSNLAELHLRIMRAEGRPAFLPEYSMDREALDVSIREQVENVDAISPAMLIEAYDAVAEARRIFDAIARDFDGIIAPSTVGVAPVGLASTGDLIFNGFWTLLHVPCINIPLRSKASGLPVGLTLTGPRGADRRLLALAGLLDGLS